MKHSLEVIQDNFQFLLTEVRAQVQRTHDLLKLPDKRLLNKIKNRESYINNLKTIIENDCFERIHEVPDLDKHELSLLRATLVMVANLERLADVCVNIGGQLSYLEHCALPDLMSEQDYAPMFKLLLDGLDKVMPALATNSLSQALQICRAEFSMDCLYSSAFHQQVKLLATTRSEHVQSHLTVLFIYYYLERMGDLLLNIGEQIIFAVLEQRIKIEQFDSLQQTLKSSGYTENFENINFQALWGSRSGCHIGKLELPDSDSEQEQGSLYKEGEPGKIIKEKESLDIWNQLFPGLVPRIYGYTKDSDRSALLLEFLRGYPLNELFLTKDEGTITSVLLCLETTVEQIWNRTLEQGPFQTDYLSQLQSRMEDVLKVHPDMKRDRLGIGSAPVLSTENLIQHCSEIESLLPAPFSVRIHGDFNTNNILYDHETECVHYIDLYRSRQYDYVQDSSVFIVSNFRVPTSDAALCRKLNMIIAHFYSWSKAFAKQKNDQTFSARMALALARSFFTSARFEGHEHRAREMFMRSIFLLESVYQFHQKKAVWSEFTFPDEILFI